MHTNLSILDTTLRLIGGAIFGAICGAFGLWIGILAVIPIVTGLAGYCPLYSILGIKTCSVENTAEKSDSKESLEESYKMAS